MVDLGVLIVPALVALCVLPCLPFSFKCAREDGTHRSLKDQTNPAGEDR